LRAGLAQRGGSIVIEYGILYENQPAQINFSLKTNTTFFDFHRSGVNRERFMHGSPEQKNKKNG